MSEIDSIGARGIDATQGAAKPTPPPGLSGMLAALWKKMFENYEGDLGDKEKMLELFAKAAESLAKYNQLRGELMEVGPDGKLRLKPGVTEADAAKHLEAMKEALKDLQDVVRDLPDGPPPHPLKAALAPVIDTMDRVLNRGTGSAIGTLAGFLNNPELSGQVNSAIQLLSTSNARAQAQIQAIQAQFNMINDLVTKMLDSLHKSVMGIIRK